MTSVHVEVWGGGAVMVGVLGAICPGVNPEISGHATHPCYDGIQRMNFA